jgi:hypothetical protein
MIVLLGVVAFSWNAYAEEQVDGSNISFSKDFYSSGVNGADVLGIKKVMVLRVYFNDYTATSRYSKTQVEGFFSKLDTLWQDTSYSKISISYQISDLFQLPDDRSLYIDDFATGDLSNGGKFDKVLNDAIANSPAGLDWTNIDSVMVVMAETNAAQFHRGQATGSRTLHMGPGGVLKTVGAGIFSENPSDTDLQVWGRWAHELGHAFQQGGPAHPSNYNSEFELMDSNYPGQTGAFEKESVNAFPGWLPSWKYQTFTPSATIGGGVGVGGGDARIWAIEYDINERPNVQAVKAYVTNNLYYLISVRRRVLGDELNGDFQGGPTGTNGIPDEGVLIERVMIGGNPSINDCVGLPTPCNRWVEVKGKGGNRNNLWKAGDQYDGVADGISIEVQKKSDENYFVQVRYNNQEALQPDVMLNPWRSPPGNAWETTDIWIDSPVNGYDVYRYGKWDDGTGNLVPTGNGDDPAVGQDNRIYARVRNVGGQPANNVVVKFGITDPPGLGIAGATGWKSIGQVTQAEFPALASIAPGTFADAYVVYNPNFTVSPADMTAGIFAFHTCLRVKIDPVLGETVLGNQDGDMEQENIDYFQAPATSPGEIKFFDVIRLHNDDLKNRSFFYLNYKSNLPDDWVLDINDNMLGLDLGPNEVRDISVFIKPPIQPKIHKSGQLRIPQTYLADLDEGLITSEDADFWFEAVTATERYLVSQNGAKFARAGTTSIGKEGCRVKEFSSSRMDIDKIPVGTYICALTSKGRYSEFRVDEPIGRSPGTFVITFTTWSNPIILLENTDDIGNAHMSFNTFAGKYPYILKYDNISQTQVSNSIKIGNKYTVEVEATSMRLLNNDLDKGDKHPEFNVLGGVQVQVNVMQPTSLSCDAQRQSQTRVFIKGKLEGFKDFYNKEDILQVMIEGVGDKNKLLTETGAVVKLATDGTFSGYLRSSKNDFTEATCLFAGTDLLMSSSGGYVQIKTTGLRGDLNNNGVSADAGDLVLMKRASIGEIIADSRYDLNNNERFADAGDLVLMKRASIGEIIL